MAKGLTERQQQILEVIADYIRENQFPPSIREIQEAVGIGSLRGVTVHLDALAKKGYIERGKTSRSIRILHPAYQAAMNAEMLPLLGYIAAGEPLLAENNIDEMVPVPSEMVRNVKGAFLLKVRGDSMSGEGINPRDLVIVKPQQTARHGELAAVMIEGEATVKRVHFENGTVKLMPSNPAYEPIEIRTEDARVIGKIVGLIRDYEGMAF
jgi:repressor LexA